MKWKNLHFVIAVAAVTLISTQSFAQGYVDDAQRAAQPLVGGTARTLSLGGAFSSLGGDIGTLSANPAGLGFYRRSDISVTPQYNSSNVQSTYFFNKADDRSGFKGYSLANFGVVFAHSTPAADRGLATDNRLVSFAFGAGYSRNSTINRNTSFAGFNSGASFGSFLAQQANASGIGGTDYGSTLAGIAYDEYLINPTNSSNTAFTPVQASGLSQNGRLQERGYTDESNMSFGANFGNVVYIGAGLNFENTNYQRQTDFYETGIVDPANMIDGITYSKFTSQSGNGINGKAGIILNLVNALHIGGYVQSPTNYQFFEQTNMGLWGLKNNQLIAPSVNVQDASGNTVPGTYAPFVGSSDSYHVKTPYKYTVGASLILGKFALFTGDATYLDYKQTHFSSGNSASDMLINSQIQAKYKAVVNYKAGAELKFGALLLRAGYAYYPSPIVNATTDADQRVVSAGLGIHIGLFYIDFAGMRDYSRSYRQLYTLADGTGPTLKQYNTINSGTVTIGTRF